MKKLISFALAALLLLSTLVGCESKSSSTGNSETQTEGNTQNGTPDLASDKNTTESSNETSEIVTNKAPETTDTAPESTQDISSSDMSNTSPDNTKDYTDAGIYASILANKKQYCEIIYYPSADGTKTYNNRYAYINEYNIDTAHDLFSRYAVFDIDGDGDAECFVEASQLTLLLFFEEGEIYGHIFGFREMDTIYKNGNIGWHGLSEEGGLAYGEYKLTLSGIDYKYTELWHIENDGEENVRYYIGDRQVTKNEFDAYVDGLSSAEIDWMLL